MQKANVGRWNKALCLSRPTRYLIGAMGKTSAPGGASEILRPLLFCLTQAPELGVQHSCKAWACHTRKEVATNHEEDLADSLIVLHAPRYPASPIKGPADLGAGRTIVQRLSSQTKAGR